MNRLLFVVNNYEEFDCSNLLAKYLGGWKIDFAIEMPTNPSDFRLIILWSYHKIIKHIPEPNNVIIFHSSDLPQGRGWAPLYYAIAEEKEFFVISGILAAPEVDSGDIVIKARFRILPNYTASILRRFDNEVSIMAIRKILDRFKDRPLISRPQRGQATYRKRRTKDDNLFDVDRPFRELVSHFRACELQTPALFEHEGQMYSVTVTPASAPEFPQNIEFIFVEDEIVPP
jgi:methionyl-tRNA formyltransferase